VGSNSYGMSFDRQSSTHCARATWNWVAAFRQANERRTRGVRTPTGWGDQFSSQQSPRRIQAHTIRASDVTPESAVAAHTMADRLVLF
jgi:hypothetical protein